MAVRLTLFGSPTIDRGGHSHALAFERRHQLIAFLALKRAWVTRSELATLFWPEQPPKLAFTNLRKTLFRLQSLPWGDAVEVQEAALRFLCESDAADFEVALRERRVEDALALRRGELLEGFDDASSEAWTSWLRYERDRLRLAWRDAALEHLASGLDATDGIELSARLLADDPLDEAALRAHLGYLAQGGQAARARQAYREFTARLASDLGIAPGAELRALHDSLGTTVAPLPALPARTDDGFVGRSDELRRLAKLFAQPECRLVCVLGAGGVGKTRFARHAMQTLAGEHADGAAFVPLDDVASSRDLGGRIARELGMQLRGRDDPLDQVAAFVGDQQMLIVLDNFEQLVDAAPALQRLVEQCPRLRVVVTSRVRLAVPMEWLLLLDGLPCPEPEDEDRIEAFDAVRLFVRAAQRVEPALVASAEAGAILDICRQVEGLPLALELAAAWTRVLSCSAIADELRQGTELLRAVDPSRPARQASIDVVFEQSWRLLTATERETLARLSVFRGGFSMQAARAVAGASLPVLGALADKSLLRKDGKRSSLHPLVQQLAALRLATSDARGATERAHADHYARLLAGLNRAVENGDRDALDQVDGEIENCRLAWRWSIDHGADDLLRRCATALFYFCDHRGRFGEGIALLGDALGSTRDASLAPLLRSQVAHLEYRLDRYPEARALASEALTAARRARDHLVQAMALQVLGSCSLRVGHLDQARAGYAEAHEHAVAAGDVRKAAAMIHNRALVERALGRGDEAQRLFTEAMAGHKSVGDVSGEALALANLSNLLRDRNERDAAFAHLKAALALCERHGLLNTQGVALAGLTQLAVEAGDIDGALGYGRRALEIADVTGNRNVAAWSRFQLARIAVRRNDVAGARADLAAGLEIAFAIGRPSLLLGGALVFAELLDAMRELLAARRLRVFILEHPAMSAQDRSEVEPLVAAAGGAAADHAWPDLDLETLARRIVVEAGVAHAPLVAALRDAR